MKKYVLKDTIINLQTLETNVYYQGKDGWVFDNPCFCEGYKRECDVKAKITRENNLCEYTKIDDVNVLESGKWLHHQEIVVIED